MILTHNIAHNIPFISIFLAMFAGIITPLVNDGKKSCLIHKLTTIIIGILSVLLLIHVNYNQERFTFLMGHFPSPWGNELKAGPMEAVLAVAFSVVMFLTVMGGQYMIEKDIAEKKQKKTRQNKCHQPGRGIAQNLSAFLADQGQQPSAPGTRYGKRRNGMR